MSARTIPEALHCSMFGPPVSSSTVGLALPQQTRASFRGPSPTANEPLIEGFVMGSAVGLGCATLGVVDSPAAGATDATAEAPTGSTVAEVAGETAERPQAATVRNTTASRDVARAMALQDRQPFFRGVTGRFGSTSLLHACRQGTGKGPDLDEKVTSPFGPQRGRSDPWKARLGL